MGHDVARAGVDGQVVPQALAMPHTDCGALIVGFGPAGLGVFTGALAGGDFDALLESGVYAVEAGTASGTGALGRYAIRSDSHAESFLAALGSGDGPLAHLAGGPVGRRLQAGRGGPVPLTLATRFQVELASAVVGLGAARGHDIVWSGWVATGARREARGWCTDLVSTDGTTRLHRRVRARSLVLATGARQTEADLAAVQVCGVHPWRRGGPTLGSDDVVSYGGDPLVRDALAGSGRPPRVLIVGASHSALASALVLLGMPGMDLAQGAVTILHSTPLRPMYVTPEAARAEGFLDFGPQDICPKTGRVFPLAGLRSDSRELLCSIRGFGARPPETRVSLRALTEQEPAVVRRLLRDADLVVLATGYRPSALALSDEAGAPIRLAGAHGPGRLVDASSQVLDVRGSPVPGVYATGLNCGYPLAGRHGEPSFTGQANGLSLWQTDIGAQIARAVLAGERHARAGAVRGVA